IRGHREDPANHVHEHAWQRFFGGPIGHAVCGTMTSVHGIDRRALRAFVARQFVPANMVLAATGGITRERLRRAVQRVFPTDGPAPGRRPRLGSRRRGGLVRLTRRDLTQAYVVRLIAVPPAPRLALALSVAMEIVGADPDARLFQEVRERLGLGYDLSTGVDQGPDWAVAVVSASAARDDAGRLCDTIDHTCREAAQGFTADELARARKKIRYRFARLADSRQERAASHAERALSGLPSLAATARLLAAIDAREVDEAWRRALAAPTLTTVLTG
ncbi:MAG: insulinase family protein, partial [Candidatus Binatia bacterium]